MILKIVLFNLLAIYLNVIFISKEKKNSRERQYGKFPANGIKRWFKPRAASVIFADHWRPLKFVLFFCIYFNLLLFLF